MAQSFNRTLRTLCCAKSNGGFADCCGADRLPRVQQTQSFHNSREFTYSGSHLVVIEGFRSAPAKQQSEVQRAATFSSLTRPMSGDSETRLFVARLSRDTRNRDLEDLFGDFGRLRDVHVKPGFAFVVLS